MRPTTQADDDQVILMSLQSALQEKLTRYERDSMPQLEMMRQAGVQAVDGSETDMLLEVSQTLQE